MVDDTWETLKLLADPTRLRVLFLLERETLSVVELQEILGMGQSRISSHLALLRGGGLVRDRKDGKRTFYTLADDLTPSARELLAAAWRGVEPDERVRRDREALDRVIEERARRSEKYFNEVAGRLGKDYCPGRSWEAVGQLLCALLPPLEVADLGAGEGHLAHLLAPRARKIYCIDRAPKMVEAGRALAREHGIENIEYLLGEIESTPLPDASVDLVLFSQALHHAAQPERSLAEAHRILRPGGQIVILDLREHVFERARELYADQWLGFNLDELRTLLGRARFDDARVRVVDREQQEPFFETILATAVKAG